MNSVLELVSHPCAISEETKLFAIQLLMTLDHASGAFWKFSHHNLFYISEALLDLNGSGDSGEILLF